MLFVLRHLTGLTLVSLSVFLLIDGGSYLELLRFFLNHRRFLRSRHAERQGKSPCELLTGHAHPHWLTLLGLGELQPRRV